MKIFHGKKRCNVMDKKYRVVHYINQFYGGYGGEDTAGMGIVVKEQPVGPGLALKGMFGNKAEIVATIICGDNHIAENLETVVPEVVEIVKKYKPDIFIAGPGFNAGRYGMACGATTAAVAKALKIPSVTALYSENPGTDLNKNRCYILKTENNARHMKDAIKKVVDFSLHLMSGEIIGDGKKEGYHGSGPAVEIDYSIPASKRAIKMLLAKYNKEPFRTEVVMPNHEEIPVPILGKPLSEARIALVTDGGLVPIGNPDRMVVTNSTSFKFYSIKGKDKLNSEDYEVRHQGYDNAFVVADPNRLVPVDAMRSLEKEGFIGSLFDSYFMTAGVMTPMEMGKKFGEGIAEKLKENNVDAVILTST